MMKVPAIKDGFVLIPIEASKEYSTLLRRFAEILYTVGNNKEERDRATWLAYCLECARTQPTAGETK